MNTNKLQQWSTRVIVGEKGGGGVNEPPHSLLDTVSLFRPQESLTRPVNRHTSLVPAALSSFLSRRDPHSHTRTHTNALTKAQTSPSEIFNRARQLALPPPSFIILYLLVCPAACSLSSSVVSAVFFFLPFSSVHLFSPLSRAPVSPVARTRLATALPDYFSFLISFHLDRPPFTCSYAPLLILALTSAALGAVPLLLPPPLTIFFFFFYKFLPPPNNTTSGSAFVWRESIILLHPPTFCLPLSVSFYCLFGSLSPPHASALYSLT